MAVKRYDGSAWQTVAGLGSQGPAGTSATLANAAFTGPAEVTNTSTSAAPASMNIDLVTSGTWYYTGASTSNFTINFRGNSSATLNSILAVGSSIAVNLFVTNTGTAYYPTSFSVDGSAVTPKWSGGVAPSAGNANAIDAYTFLIIKTGVATFTVIAGGAVKFA